jgi:hypothetical protein
MHAALQLTCTPPAHPPCRAAVTMVDGNTALLVGILGNLGALLLEAGRSEDALAEIEQALEAVRMHAWANIVHTQQGGGERVRGLVSNSHQLLCQVLGLGSTSVFACQHEYLHCLPESITATRPRHWVRDPTRLQAWCSTEQRPCHH